MQQILYLIQKEFRQIFRDRSMIGILFVMPLLQIFLLGHAVTTDIIHLRLLIHDRDRTPLSREYIQQFTHSKYFDLVGVEDDYNKLTHYLDDARANLVIVIPEHFQRSVVRQEHPKVQLLVDGLDGNTAGIAMGYVSEITLRYQTQLMLNDPKLAMSLKNVRFVQSEPRFWFNPNLESRVYIVPGLIAMILTIITLFLTSMGIVREKEIGTLEQLMVTPIKSYQLIIGKIIPFSILAFIEITLAMLFIYLIFGIGIVGSVPLLFFEAGIFIFTTLGLGIFISTVAETQQQAVFIAWFFMIFAILLSGFFVPIANMPDAIQYATYINPLRYFLTILREIYLKGTSLRELLPETLSMIGFGVVVFSLAVLRFRRRLQ